MKKLLILTAVLMLTGSAVGCRWCESWCRGSAAPAPVVYPAGSPCDPCAAPCAAPAACTPPVCGYAAPVGS